MARRTERPEDEIAEGLAERALGVDPSHAHGICTDPVTGMSGCSECYFDYDHYDNADLDDVPNVWCDVDWRDEF